MIPPPIPKKPSEFIPKPKNIQLPPPLPKRPTFPIQFPAHQKSPCPTTPPYPKPFQPPPPPTPVKTQKCSNQHTQHTQNIQKIWEPTYKLVMVIPEEDYFIATFSANDNLRQYKVEGKWQCALQGRERLSLDNICWLQSPDGKIKIYTHTTLPQFLKKISQGKSKVYTCV